MKVPLSSVTLWNSAITNGIVAITTTAPRTGRSSLSPRRSCRPRADHPVRGVATVVNGSATARRPRPLGLLGCRRVPGARHQLADLARRIGDRGLGVLLTSQGGVQLGAQDRLHRVPLVGAGPP